jgi:hypothetical protein
MFDVQYIIIVLSGLRCADRHYTTFMHAVPNHHASEVGPGMGSSKRRLGYFL